MRPVGWLRLGACLTVLTMAGGFDSVSADQGNRIGDDRRDLHSFGHPEQVRVRHIDLDLSIDFERKQLAGSVLLSYERQPGSPADAPLVVDTKGLEILDIERPDGEGTTKVEPLIGKGDPILGESLTIPIKTDSGRIRIRYKTSPNAGALQWLDPARTAGGKQPFLFTQSEAIQARTWIPLQDSPGVRITYKATIRVPKGLTAVMAADTLSRDQNSDPSVFQFTMGQPIPSYLIALAVGDLTFRPLGTRTGVWAERSVVEKAAFEFADTEQMIRATEAFFGPYRWGRYDLLVLPPSFPFGGMENPKLTFATPTILAGDRSLVSLVAHELAHSWSGNLVTNATWRDFWLNEGFTVYLERRIIEAVYGVERAQVEAVLGLQELRDELTRLPEADQILHLDLAGRDPDDGMTQVAYEKGALFLTELEHAFGRERFDAFLLDYFNRHAFQSITTGDFLDDLKGRLFTLDQEAASKIDLKAWVESPGLKAPFTEPTAGRLEAVDRSLAEWKVGTTPASKLATKDWSTQEWLHFLRGLPESIPAERMAELDAAFGLTDRGNAEIAAQWLQIAVKNGYQPADARLEAFLTSIGRRKFLMPLYRELIQTPEGKTRAAAIYAKARPFYHPIAVDSVDKLLGVRPGENRP
ncbi:M1 family metallopeptidase [Tundrisphaera lichenicola]|uniref:M1 family metallopeptidase n=1 Tax=Tundrisphaera lichenicola TaxID=2029860 RepID=UPI003EBA4307